MPFTLKAYSDLSTLPFDQLIDARSPAEFAKDHIPGATNLPALNNDQRAIVGTTYIQDSRFKARKMGAAMVARNIAKHLEGPLAKMDGGWRPLIYCWRGGQRSGAFASYLSQIGWRADTIDGGYKAYRKLVNELCYKAVFPSPVVLLDGNTGTAKTNVLERLKNQGVQVLDLERAANHRGSAFGARAGGQPSQKKFEGCLAHEIAKFDPNRPVVIEAESSKVGARVVPPSVWKAMRAAKRIKLTAPVDARADYLVNAYDDLWENPTALAAGLEALRPLHKVETILRWKHLVAQGAFRDFVAELITQHYDVRYGKPREHNADIVLDTPILTPQTLDQLTGRVQKALTEL